MTEDEKILLKELFARYPYGVICEISNGETSITEKLGIGGLSAFTNGSMKIRPYLKPMTSMTGDDFAKLKAATCPEGTGTFDNTFLLIPMSHFGDSISYYFMSNVINWLYANHFDFNGLVSKGLAIAVTTVFRESPLLHWWDESPIKYNNSDPMANR